MSAKPSEFKEKLNKAIKEAIERFRKDDSMPQGAFSRERVFSLKVLTKSILAMGGGDIAQELENLNIEATVDCETPNNDAISFCVIVLFCLTDGSFIIM